MIWSDLSLYLLVRTRMTRWKLDDFIWSTLYVSKCEMHQTIWIIWIKILKDKWICNTCNILLVTTCAYYILNMRNVLTHAILSQSSSYIIISKTLILPFAVTNRMWRSSLPDINCEDRQCRTCSWSNLLSLLTRFVVDLVPVYPFLELVIPFEKKKQSYVCLLWLWKNTSNIH